MVALLRVMGSTILLGLSLNSAPAQSPDCSKDLDACVVLAIAENAAFVDECAKLYPKSKDILESALAEWSVVKLPIPGIAPAITAESPMRKSLGARVEPYLRRIPSYERDIECSGRVEMMKESKPTLRAEIVRLPPDALVRYIK